MPLSFESIISIGHQIAGKGRKRKKGLTDVEVAVLYCAWYSLSYKDFTNNYQSKHQQLIKPVYSNPNSEFSPATLPAASSRLMSTFGNYFEINSLNQRNFKAHMLLLYENGIFEQQSLLIENDFDAIPSFLSINVDNQETDQEKYIDQSTDIKFLNDALLSYNLLLLIGFSGVGKTTLLDRLGIILKDKYQYFYTDFGYIDDLEEWMIDLLSQVNVEYELNPISIRDSFFKFLETQNNLIVLDSVGKLNDKFQSFLETFAVKNDSKSRIIISSRRNISFDIPERHYCVHRLNGLRTTEGIRHFFSQFDLKDDELWTNLAKGYSGNFRELSYVCRFIRDFYGGSVSRYLKVGSHIVSSSLKDFFASANFSDLDIYIFDICSKKEAVVSKSLISALRRESEGTNNLLYRIDYLLREGFLEYSQNSEQNTISYSIPPLLKNYLIQEKRINE